MRGSNTINKPADILHVYDLPQLHTRPSFEALSEALKLLQLQPTSFSQPEADRAPCKIDPDGVPGYLTAMVSSKLLWLNDEQKEVIWDLASVRLSERSGRNAMPSMMRSFHVNEELTVNLFEPSLTEDHLGLKTWTSSLLLAKRLPLLHHHIPSTCDRILELGSGTGLVGIAAGLSWDVHVVLTDLPEIVPNLQRNVESNVHLMEKTTSKTLQVQALDWSDETHAPKSENDKFLIIVSADPIYSLDHPRMLVNAVSRWISKNDTAHFIVELPLREGYQKERQMLRDFLADSGMEVADEGTEVGFDDWQGADGKAAEVECWWSVWKSVRIAS